MSALGHNGGSAFPACNEANVNDTMGMTLRDYFAGQALVACMPSGMEEEMEPFEIAFAAYAMADAMLKARETSNEN